MRVESFFNTHPVFTRAEFVDFSEREGGSSNASTVESLLAYHRQRGRLRAVRRGLFAVVPLGVNPDEYQPDRYLVGAKAWSDGVLGLHTALELHGVGHSMYEDVHVFCDSSRRPFTDQGVTFVPSLHPKPVRDAGGVEDTVEVMRRQGLEIQVIGLERTVVDCLTRPAMAGGWEEVVKSIANVPYLELDALVHYVEVLGNATTAAKVGYVLEAKQDDWFVDEACLARMEQLAPDSPRYVDKSRESEYVARWSLMVPTNTTQFVGEGA